MVANAQNDVIEFDVTGSEILVNDLTQNGQFSGHSAVLADGRVLIAWGSTTITGNNSDRTNYHIKAKILNPDGTTSVPEFRADGTLQIYVGATNVFALNDGGFGISYSSGLGV